MKRNQTTKKLRTNAVYSLIRLGIPANLAVKTIANMYPNLFV